MSLHSSKILKNVSRTQLAVVKRYLEAKSAEEVSKLENVLPDDLLLKQGRIKGYRQVIKEITQLTEKVLDKKN